MENQLPRPMQSVNQPTNQPTPHMHQTQDRTPTSAHGNGASRAGTQCQGLDSECQFVLGVQPIALGRRRKKTDEEETNWF
jgi:hypothetical protein